MKQSGENKSLVALLGLLAFLLLAVVYYYVVLPKDEAKTRTTNSIKQLQVETSELQQKVAVLSVTDIEEANDYELRKKLPITRELDNLLHTIHEVELLSESKIVSISFNNYDGEVSQTNFITPTDKTDEEANKDEEVEDGEGKEKSEETDVAEDADETKPVTPIDIELLPDELKLISLNIVLEVLDYEHLLQFLNEVEEIERIVRIDSVNFYQPGEEELAQEDPDERLSVSVQLTTFYSEEVGN